MKGDKFFRGEFGNISHNDCTYKDKESATKAREIVTCIQSKSYAVQKEQLDPMLRGVAEWEIPWEDLHVGERIGIGKTQCFKFIFCDRTWMGQHWKKACAYLSKSNISFYFLAFCCERVGTCCCLVVK